MMKKKSAAAAGIVAVSAALCLNGVSGFRSQAVKNKDETEPVAKKPETAEKRQAETIGQLMASGKDETVYVTAGADGSVKKVIVSEWLKNNGENITLDDMTNLLHIENVKGTESFSENSDGSVTWAAGGNDIYYQGESEEELPVSMKITYKLDGKKISPEKLAGKSGRVTMRFDYENHTFEEVEIDGEKEEICTPFLMLTGMVLPGDTFRNVEVENGKVLSDGNNQVVVGTAFPGLAESLKLSEIEDFEDKEIPDYVEVTADVEDFSLMMTATVATTGTLSQLDLDENLDLDELQDKLDELTDASTQLVDGSGELSDGVQTLWDAIVEYTDGMNSADEGTGELLDGINTLNEKKVDLVDGVTELREGMETLDDGASDLKDGVDQYTDGVGTLAKGASDLDSGAGQVKAGIDTLNGKKGELVNGVSELAAGSNKLKEGADTLQKKVQVYTENVQSLVDGISALKGMVNTMVGGTQAPSGNGAPGQNADAAAGAAAEAASNAAAEASANTASLETSLSEVKSGVEAAQSSLAELQVSPAGHDLGYSTNVDEVKAQMRQSIEGMGLEPEVTAQLNALVDGMDIQVTVEEQNGEAPDFSALAESLNQIHAAAEGAGAAAAGLQAAGQSQTEAARSQAAVLQAQADAIRAQQDAMDELQGSLRTLETLGKGLCGYNADLVKGTAALAAGADQVSAGTGTLAQGAGALSAGIQQLADGAASLKAGTSKLNAGAAELDSNSGELRDGTRKLKDGSVELLDGGRKLEDGAGELSDGVQELADGAVELKDGTTELNDAGVDLKDGVLELKDGSDELRDGMKEFDEEGIHKLTDKVEGDLLVVLDRLKAAADADKNYTSFGGRMENVEGSVKFIIETEGIGR